MVTKLRRKWIGNTIYEILSSWYKNVFKTAFRFHLFKLNLILLSSHCSFFFVLLSHSTGLNLWFLYYTPKPLPTVKGICFHFIKIFPTIFSHCFLPLLCFRYIHNNWVNVCLEKVNEKILAILKFHFRMHLKNGSTEIEGKVLLLFIERKSFPVHAHGIFGKK